jgi:hypothetical protein
MGSGWRDEANEVIGTAVVVVWDGGEANLRIVR